MDNSVTRSTVLLQSEASELHVTLRPLPSPDRIVYGVESCSTLQSGTDSMAEMGLNSAPAATYRNSTVYRRFPLETGSQ
jgi:hypothetical protein